MTRLVALDTETTGLDPRVDEIFEVAAIVLDPLGGDLEYCWTLEPSPEAVEQMHPKAAEVNRYHERTSEADWEWDAHFGAKPEYDLALSSIADVIDGAHLLGAVPWFDTGFLTELYWRRGYEHPRWHYHLIDVEAFAMGWLARQAEAVPPPWDSDELMDLVGVVPPEDGERHTALADARWAARVYRVLGGAFP